MIDLSVKAHRTFLRADAGTQKLFVMLKLLPTVGALRDRPPLDLAIVVDTSGSMSRSVRGGPGAARSDESGGPSVTARVGGPTKIQQAMDALRALLASEQLRPEDRVSLIHFDDESRVLASGEVGVAREQLLRAIPGLAQRKGGTWMGAGLLAAAQELRGREHAARRVLLLTDGRAADENECRRSARLLAARNARIIALGLGDEYNEDLLTELCALTLGAPYHLPDEAALAQIFEKEIGAASRQVVADARATVQTAEGAEVVSALRVYPTLADVGVSGAALLLGGLEAGDHTVFLIEMDVSPSPPVRVPLARLGLTYQILARPSRDELAPVDLVVEFTADTALASHVDPEVMGYVQQRSVDRLIRHATQQAQSDPLGAAVALHQARTLTQRLGNYEMLRALARAEEELRVTGSVTQGTSKTIKVGSRTQTIKMQGSVVPAQSITSAGGGATRGTRTDVPNP